MVAHKFYGLSFKKLNLQIKPELCESLGKLHCQTFDPSVMIAFGH